MGQFIETVMSLDPQSVSDHNPLRSLYRCGQFVLGPQSAPGLNGWKCLTIADGLELTSHPELSVRQMGEGTKTLTLLGFMLDPYHPQAQDEDILRTLLGQFASLPELLDATGPYGGRWVLIATLGRECYLFADALGLRQAFHADPKSSGAVYVMSEPGIGAQMLGLPVDPDARAYMQSPVVSRNPEYRWPASATPYKAIHRLLPNHCLDLRRGDSVRFWPVRPIEPMTPDQCVDKLTTLLKGLLSAAAQRYELAVSITAGIDSRVVLAACRDIKDDVTFVTVQQWHMVGDSPDIRVPESMLEALGLRHDIVRAPKHLSSEFDEVFRASVSFAHDHYAPDARAILDRYQRRKVAVTGSAGEVARCPFREHLPFFDRKRVTPAYLSRLALNGRSDFGRRHFAEWMRDVGAREHVNTLDLFEWEQECGSWLAMTELEFDIAWRDIFTPFNNRELLMATLSTPTRWRKGPDYPLFRRLIERLWPELLQYPINPHRTRSTAVHAWNAAMELLRHLVHPLRYR